MKALRFHGQNDIRLEDVEVPQCGKDQVKVRPDMSCFRVVRQPDLDLGQTGLRWHLWHRFVTVWEVCRGNG